MKRKKKIAAGPGPAETEEVSPRSSGRKWLFRLTAMLGVTAGFFAVLEAGLRLFGFGFPVQFFVPSPAGQKGVLVENSRFSLRYFSKALMRIPQSTAFVEAKAPGTLRVFVFGESAAEGDPGPSFGFARILQVLLEDRYPGRGVEVINTAVTAINSHVIRPIALECARYDADVWVVYMGNNEVVGPFGSGTVFGPQAPSLDLIRANIAVKSTRIGQAMDAIMQGSSRRGGPKVWNGMEMFLDQQVALSDPRTAAVYRNFRSNLSDMVAAGVHSGAKVILSTVGSNLRDCPPFASLHRRDLPAGALADWERLYQAGSALEDAGSRAEAEAKYEEALRIDDQFAELHFRMGRCLASLHRPEEALRHYVLARDLDTLRFRCDSRLNEIVRETAAGAAGPGVRLADSEAAFRSATQDGVPGREWFHEHVHPTPAGNYLVAVELAKQVVPAVGGATRGGAVSADAFLPIEACGLRLGLTDFDRAQMAGEMERRVGRPPFTHQLGHAADVARHEAEVAELQARCRTNAPAAIAIDRDALARSPGDWRLHDNFAGVLLQTGDADGAAGQWREVIRLLPHRTQSYDLLGSVLLEKSRFDEAAAAYQRALEIEPGFFEGRIGLGRARLGQNRVAEAITLFRGADALQPGSARVHNHLGLALLQAGKAGDAGAAFREALRLDPDFLSARLNLANSQMVGGRGAEAVATYREAIQKSPDNVAARVELAKALMKLGRGAEALEASRETARLHPWDFEARLAFATALVRSQRFDEAATEYAGVLRIRPDSFEAHLNYGTILARQGNTDEAGLQFEEAVRLKPDLVPARLNAAAAWMEKHRWDKAILHLQAVLKIDPGNSRARGMLETALAAQKAD